MGPDFSEKVAEKCTLWDLWTVHGWTVHGRIGQKFGPKKKKKRGKHATAKTQKWEVGSKQILRSLSLDFSFSFFSWEEIAILS